MRVLIADDHPSMRAGLRLVLQSEGIEVCAEASDAPSAVALAISTRPDICVLDVHMPGSGIWAAERITTRVPETQVVMLSVSRAKDDVFGALRAGASGYLLKDNDIARLHLALVAVMEGEAAIPRELVASILDEFRARSHRRTPLVDHASARLTSREQEVLDFMVEHRSTAEIAQRLFVSRATVRSHVSAILHKLRVADRDAAVSLVVGRGTN